MAQATLIGRRDLLNHGASSDLLDGFRIRPIEVSVVTPGALGVAAFNWRVVGSDNWSVEEPSEAGSSWTWQLPDPAFAEVVFPAQAYVAGDSWIVSTSGEVAPQATAPAGLTARRFDVVDLACIAISDDFATWAQPRCVPPIISITEGQRAWAAVIAVYRLVIRSGITPKGAGAGDDNLRLRAEDAEHNIKAIGRSDNRPPGLVDSSVGGKGGGIPLMPRSRSRRGFGDFT